MKEALADAIRHTFHFNGRTNRKGFWLFMRAFLLIHALVFSALWALQDYEDHFKAFFDISVDSVWDNIFDLDLLKQIYRNFVFPLPQAMARVRECVRRRKKAGLNGLIDVRPRIDPDQSGLFTSSR